jgi:NAD kinase
MNSDLVPQVMERRSERKLVVVKRKTRLEDLLVRFNSAAQAKFYVEHLGADFSDYEDEHGEYLAAVQETEAVLGRLGRPYVLDRNFLPNFMFGPDDLVFAVGQDGLVANTLKYLQGQPLVGINPSPKRWDGVLLPFKVGELAAVAPDIVRGARPRKEVTMARATLNDGQSLLAVNDLFVGQRTHVSARYQLTLGKQSERQSSSGIIVSTGLGSTGWLKSILAGALGVAQAAAKVGAQLAAPRPFPWDADYLCFSVREPFPSKATSASLVFGKISGARPLRVTSQMPENDVIFSDGIESDFLEFNAGVEARIELAERRGLLVV